VRALSNNLETYLKGILHVIEIENPSKVKTIAEVFDCDNSMESTRLKGKRLRVVNLEGGGFASQHALR
jgi:Mn-dependent DtxR family transcriptional regulator